MEMRFHISLAGDRLAVHKSFPVILRQEVPNYFGALETMRGQECSRRMMLIANSLKYLAEKNNTQPGEKICEPLELNQALDLAQGALAISGNMVYIPAFFRYGTEPDCADNGDFIINFTMGENGKIIQPACSKYQGNRVDYFLESGMHYCDMSKVDGEITTGNAG